MNQEKLVFLIPYVGSLGISLGILIYAWTRRQALGANAFFWYVLGQTLYIFGNILEMTNTSLSEKLFWESFQWIVSSLPLIAFPIFVIQYVEYKPWNFRGLYRLFFFAPIIFSMLILTDVAHNFFYINPRVLQNGLFTNLIYDYSPIFITYSIYIYFIAFMSCTLLSIRIFQPHDLYRSQIAFILLGVLLPIGASLLSLSGIYLTTQRDVSPFIIAIGNLLLAWGIYRFRIFDVSPIARDMVFNAMVDPVVILDNKNKIIDINMSMLTLLGQTSADIIGKSAEKVFANFQIPIKMYLHVSHGRTEAIYELGGLSIYYELTISPLFNSRNKMIGRIYTSHEITTIKELERELRQLNIDLEKHVRARTHELAEAYDTTLEGWARALELRDKETAGHSRRVTEATLKIARSMKISEEDIEHIRRGSLLHDIGKMGIPDEILHKIDKLTDEEQEIIKQHPVTAYNLLAPIPFLKKAMEIPYSHHEKWDGSGYPQGLKKYAIPMSARIFAIADVWDALTSNRSYNRAWPRKKAIAYLVEQSGTHFDSRIVNIFLELVEKGEI